jgi:GMP synthase (glutamine-hydrolysing)
MTRKLRTVMEQPEILIIDLGSQYTLVIGRTIRERGFRTIIVSPPRARTLLKTWRPKAIILSGGSSSVYEADAPKPPEEILNLGIPILGICYGMQWLAYNLGGRVGTGRQHKEYGESQVSIVSQSGLFKNMKPSFAAWASHGDTVLQLPKGFQVIAQSNKGQTIVGMANPRGKIWGLQFHPEVTHTENGKTILEAFLHDICKCNQNWQPADVINEIRAELCYAVIGSDGTAKKAIIGFSGGVDSTTLTAIAKPIFGANLLAVCINAGNLRESELQQIRANAKSAGICLKVVSARGRFIKALSKATHSERKRQIFRKPYKAILEEEAKKFGAEFIIQGSLATDIIESGAAGESALIKSHHNVGLNFSIQELHPLRRLFKYEIRDLSRLLGLPPEVSERQPFPGPGLFLRIVGKPVTAKRLAIIRWADQLVTEILKKHKLYDQISQLVVALDCNLTVGIKGDGRSYGYSVIVRGVLTADFMTVRGYQLPDYVRREISSAVTKHPKIVRVYYDETNKPPATTEAE